MDRCHVDEIVSTHPCSSCVSLSSGKTDPEKYLRGGVIMRVLRGMSASKFVTVTEALSL